MEFFAVPICENPAFLYNGPGSDNAKGKRNSRRHGKRQTGSRNMNDWKQEYESLNRFIADNPAIIVTPTEISIPRELREEFYLRFDKIRAALVDMHYPALPVDVEGLCSRFLQVEREVIDLLGLEGISMPVDLSTFLHTPRAGLARMLYNRVFDLLQGKMDADEFEKQCLHDLDASSAELFRLGYEWWAALTLVKHLEPDEAFRVDLDQDYNPVPAELKEIAFGRQAHHPTIRIPEFVVHSKKLDRYVGIKMALTHEVEGYAVGLRPPVRPRKRTGDTSFALDSRVMFLSFLRDPAKIPVIADIYERKLTSPDWIVEFITAHEYGDLAALEQVQRHVDAVRPVQGAYLVVINPASGDLAAPGENIRPVPAGFDDAQLGQIVASMA